MSVPAVKTFEYSSRSIHLDAYLPKATGRLPAMIVFHGGGMTAGSKSDVTVPHSVWWIEKAIVKDIIVISPNYRLLHPSTTEDIITDVHDLFRYLADSGSDFAAFLKTQSITLDTDRIGVVGISGGNYPARVAASMSSVLPRPKAWIPLYGMGGDFLLDHWVQPSSDSGGLIGLALIPSAVAALLEHGRPSSDASPKYDSSLQAYTDEENRLGLFVHFYRTGTLLDYVVGIPGISAGIRELSYEQRLKAIPGDKHKYLLPLSMDTTPALVIHGTLDTVVPTAEGVKTVADMQEIGVAVEYIWVEGAAHGLFDPITHNMVDGWEKVADQALEFIDRLLKQ